MEVINKEINSTKELFKTLNIKDDVLSIEQKKFFFDKGYLILLFKFHAFNNFLLKLRFIKNIIRRIFVVFFSRQSRKIFDII